MLTFAQPGWLIAGAAGISVVVLLHAMRRSARVVPSLALWRKLQQSDGESAASLAWPRLSWPFVLQVLTVLMIALALSQPMLSSTASENVLYLVDVSASMDASGASGVRPFDRMSSDLARLATNNNETTVLAVGAEVRPIASRIEDSHDVLARLQESVPQPESSQAAWQDAAVWAQSFSEVHDDARIRVLSDDIQTAYDALSAAALDALYVDYEGAARNVGIVDMSAELLEAPSTQADNGDAPSERDAPTNWRATVTIDVQGEITTPIHLQFHFRPDNADSFLLWSERELGTPQSGRTEVDLSLPGAGVLRASVTSANDQPIPGWSTDDEQYVSLEPPPNVMNVLLIGEPSKPFLDVLRSMDDVKLGQAEADSVSNASFSSYEIAIALEPVATSPPIPTWFAGVPLPNHSTDVIAERATWWDPNDPLAEGVAWAEIEAFPAVAQSRIDGARAPVTGGGGPLVQVWARPDRGSALATAFQPRVLDDGDSASLPAFVTNALSWLTPPQGPVQACRVGVRCRVPAGVTIKDPSEWSITVGGFGTAQPVTPTFTPRRSGLHVVTNQEGAREWLAVLPSTSQERPPLQVAGMDPSLITPRPGPLHGIEWLWLVAVLPLLADSILRVARSRPLLSTSRSGLRTIITAGLGMVAVLALASAAMRLPWPTMSATQYLVVIGTDESSALLERAKNGLGRRRSLKFVPYGLSGPGESAHYESALRLAEASVPLHQAAHIVLSDVSGEPSPDAIAFVGNLLERNRTLSMNRPVSAEPTPVAIQRIVAPEDARAGAPVVLNAQVWAELKTDATVRVAQDSNIVIERDIELERGRNLVSLTLDELEQDGTTTFDVTVTLARDAETYRSSASLVLNVRPPLRIAAVSESEDVAGPFINALSSQGIDAEHVQPESIPYDDDWPDWDGVALLEVPALAMHTRQQRALQDYVSSHGAGLMLFGGPSSFGPGGYYQTPLDTLSPLSSRIQRQAPEVAMVFVIDRSGSMQQHTADRSRLDIAKDATLAAIDLLHPSSQAGVVVFDETASVAVPLQSVSNRNSIQLGMSRIVPGGGTSMFPGIRLGHDELREADASARHMVVLSDGLSQPGPFEELLSRIAEDEISVSTVAIGGGADTLQLERIARLGQGTSHETDDVRSLPSILSQEAMLLSEGAVLEERTQPEWEDQDSLWLAGWPDTPPVLQGHVETTAKNEAKVHLRSNLGTPLLASWRFGLGRVTAFTSQAVGPWSRAWNDHTSYPKWWAQATRWVTSSSGTDRPSLRIFERFGELVAQLTVPDTMSRAQGHSPQVIVEGESQTRSLDLNEVDHGVFRARTMVSPGTYHVRVKANLPIQPEGSLHVEGTVDRRAQDEGNTWALLTQATGGGILPREGALYPANETPDWRLSPRSVPWGAIALLAYLGCLILRYGSPRQLRESSSSLGRIIRRTTSGEFAVPPSRGP